MAWLTGWDYCKKIKVPSAQIDGELSNFPLTVYLNEGNFDFSKCKADGADIRFTDGDLNPLKFERKEHDDTSEIAVYNVQIPTVSDSADTNIYMWHGNANAYNASMEAWQDMTGKALTYNGNVKLVPKPNAMRISTSTTGTDRLHYSKTGLINASKKTSMTAKIKIETAGVSQGCAFAIENGVKASYVSVKNGAVIFNSLSANAYTHTLDTLVAHEYRMELDGTSDCKYYVDDVLIFTASYADLYTLASNRFLWGDTSPNAGDGGSTVWSYVKYNLDTGGVSDNWVEWAPMSLPTSQGWDYYGTASLASLITEEYTGRMAVFDGSGGHFTSPYNNAFDFGAGNFEIENKCIFTTLPASGGFEFIFSRGVLTPTRTFYAGLINASGVYKLNIACYNTSAVFDVSVAWTPVIGREYDLSFVRNGNNILFFVDGVQVGSPQAISGSVNVIPSTEPIYFGRYTATHMTDYSTGRNLGIRFRNTAKHTANYTPPDYFEIDGPDVVFCTNFDTIYDENYAMVQHMGDSLVDATGNNVYGTPSGTTVVNTEYGKARTFNGVSDSILLNNDTWHDSWTILSLLYRDGSGSRDWENILFGDPTAIGYAHELAYSKPEIYSVLQAPDSIGTGWRTLATALSKTEGKIAVDGDKVASNSGKATSQSLKLHNFGRKSNGNYEMFKGQLVESRVSGIVRSDAWIKAESLALKNALVVITDFEKKGGSLFFGMNF